MGGKDERTYALARTRRQNRLSASEGRQAGWEKGWGGGDRVPSTQNTREGQAVDTGPKEHCISTCTHLLRSTRHDDEKAGQGGAQWLLGDFGRRNGK